MRALTRIKAHDTLLGPRYKTFCAGGNPVTDPNQLLDASGALPQAQPPWPARDGLRITGVRAIVTAPEGMPLVVVRVDTSEPGLYGLGCATFTQRYAAVAAAVDEHVAPLVDRPPPGRHRGHHPADPLLLVLAERPGAQQRAVRARSGAVGHRRQAGRHAGLRTARRTQPGRRSRSTPTPPARTIEDTLDAGRGAARPRATATSGYRSAVRAWARTARPAPAAATRARRTRTAGTSSSTCAHARGCSPPRATGSATAST